MTNSIELTAALSIKVLTGIRSYKPWKTLVISPQNPETQNMSLITGNWTQNVMRQHAFKTLKEPAMMSFLILTPRNLGFVERPNIERIFDERMLQRWSTEHLKGQMIKLCPPEAGPELLGYCAEFSTTAPIIIGMKPIRCGDNHKRIFILSKESVGSNRSLSTKLADPEEYVPSSSHIVFALEKK